MLHVQKFPGGFHNEMGTREDVILTGEPIILCIGCSHTYGHTEPEHTYPTLLQNKLKGFQVLNCGRRNYGLGLIIEWYRSITRTYKPHLVLLQIPLFCRQPFPGIQSDCLKHYTMKDGAYSLINQKIISESKFITAAQSMIEADIVRLNRFIVELIEFGIKPVVLYYRSFNDHFWFMDELTSIQYRETTRMCNNNHYHIIVHPDMNVSIFKKKGWLLDLTHPNQDGNEFISKVVYDYLQQNKILDSLV